MGANSKELLRKGLSTVITHHGQTYTWGDVTFKAVASSPGIRFGPGPIGFAHGIEHDVSLRVDRSQLAALPRQGDNLIDEDGRHYTVGGVSEMPGGFSVVMRLRINTQ